MNLQTIKKGASMALGKTKRFGRAHGPSIMVAAGIVGMAYTTYKAVKESENLQLELDTAEYELANAKTKKEKAKAYAKGAGNIALNYKGTIAGFTLSTASILTGYCIMRKRYMGATMALAVVTKQFETYRKACITENGPAADQRYMNGLAKTKIEYKDEKGKKKTEEALVDVSLDENFSYARYYDAEEAPSIFDTKNTTLNIHNITLANTTLNNQLQARGHVFLNDAFDTLGLSRTYAGAVTGWLAKSHYEYNLPEEYWDGADDLINITYKIVKRFDEGAGIYRDSIILDFNVDGVIADKINLSPFYKAPKPVEIETKEA